jgi:hypothetical protein
MVRTKSFGYRSALRWLARNDDNSWCANQDSSPTITARFIADCYARTEFEVREDLRKTILNMGLLLRPKVV